MMESRCEKSDLYDSVFDHWKGFENHEGREDRSVYNQKPFLMRRGVMTEVSQQHDPLQPVSYPSHCCIIVLRENYTQLIQR